MRQLLSTVIIGGVLVMGLATASASAAIGSMCGPRPNYSTYSTYSFPACRKSCYTPRVRLYRPYLVGYGAKIWHGQSEYGCGRH